LTAPRAARGTAHRRAARARNRSTVVGALRALRPSAPAAQIAAPAIAAAAANTARTMSDTTRETAVIEYQGRLIVAPRQQYKNFDPVRGQDGSPCGQ